MERLLEFSRFDSIPEVSQKSSGRYSHLWLVSLAYRLSGSWKYRSLWCIMPKSCHYSTSLNFPCVFPRVHPCTPNLFRSSLENQRQNRLDCFLWLLSSLRYRLQILRRSYRHRIGWQISLWFSYCKRPIRHYHFCLSHRYQTQTSRLQILINKFK